MSTHTTAWPASSSGQAEHRTYVLWYTASWQARVWPDTSKTANICAALNSSGSTHYIPISDGPSLFLLWSKSLHPKFMTCEQNFTITSPSTQIL
ncbi:hypothetical protein Ddc_23631 [Ditylenchus destructor]|nr:hypothetical protein Ddc_23631 [Ditylenchus destructor]